MRRGFLLCSLLLFLILGLCAQANLLVNGDFNLPGTYTANPNDPATLGDPASDWERWFWGGGWANTETAGWGSPGGTFHIAVGAAGNGGGGYYQLVPVIAGNVYQLTVDSGADAWWLPTGTMAMIWLRSDTGDLTDPNTIVSQDIRNTVDPAVYGQNYDIPHPWESYSLTATAPNGALFVKVELAANNATGSVGFDNASLVLVELNASDPYPANGAIGVALDDTTLSWDINRVPDPADPNFTIIDPNLVSYDLYFDDDPNLADNPIEIATGINNWTAPDYRASHTLASNYTVDGAYYWRVDMHLDTGEIVTGNIWTFDAIRSIPEITMQPAPYTLVNLNDPVLLSVTVTSVSPEHYQWYKIVDGGTDAAVGTDSNQYVVVNAQSTDDGSYYCVITNDSTVPIGTQPAIVSNTAVVGTKRQISHWSFEGGSTDSSIGGFATTVNESPTPAAAGGVGGTDGMVFDGEDMLFTDPNATYFDICNYNITVGCWIKSDSNDVPEWSPLVARNGDDDEGWQLRRGNVGAPGDQRVRFTTRGLTALSGGTDGSPSNVTPFDEQWHYVVGTYDGTSRKIYIDGIVQKVYWVADALPYSAEGDDATGTITPTASGVSIAGRYGQNPAQIDDQFVHGTYDEVEIWNYARSAAEIAQTYATITGTAICPDGTAPGYDLDGDCIVDLNDFAKLASEWLMDTSVQP